MSAGGVLLLCRDNRWGSVARKISEDAFGENLQVFLQSERGFDPEVVAAQSPSVLLSYCITWIVPESVLKSCRQAINFHPGSSAYPGIGAYNFALYDRSAEFGVVCHHMNSRPDSGDIIEERRFKIDQDESVESLKLKTMNHLLALFVDITGIVQRGGVLPRTSLAWARRPYTRRQLEELCVVTADMSSAEVERRYRAVTYPGYPGLRTRIGGLTFWASVPNREPLA